MWQLYEKYWIDFGEALTEMERNGFYLDFDHIEKMKLEAILDVERKKQ